MKFLGTLPEETAMVGDRLLTDIAGANRPGLFSIKVATIYPNEPLMIKIVRIYDSISLLMKK
ncbi:HAD hydrolase-like protein [Candidatus Woesearchaeota archaeon]|nr:HAD hydrolase-like protein [Candidatus Woesearchaeota archaeon]